MNFVQLKQKSVLFVALLMAISLIVTACELSDSEPEVVVEPGVVAEDGDAEVLDEDVVEEEVLDEDVDVVETTDLGVTDPNLLGVADAGDTFLLASTLIDANFEDDAGDIRGEMEDMLVELSNGQVLFGIAEYGGILELGDKQVPFPLSAFQWTGDGIRPLTLNFDEQALEAFPDIIDTWPDYNVPNWDQEVIDFWNSIGINPGFDLPDGITTVMYASEILDLELGAYDDFGYGAANIQDMVVDLSNGSVRYVLVDYGVGFFDDNLVAVPFSAFDVQSFQDGLIGFNANFDVNELENAPTFDRTIYDEGGYYDSTFDDDIETYWTDLGYRVQPEYVGVE